MTETLRIHTEDGLSLEAELDGTADSHAVLVFCHPHPQMGGTMKAPLLLAVRDHLVSKGWSVLRFNFRGIAGSEGTSGIGYDELKDAGAALDAACSRRPEVPVAIAGWSFGAAVAVKVAAEDDSLIACIAIAPSVSEKEGISAGLPAPETLDLGVPTLFLVGGNDDVTPPQAAREWAEQAGIEFRAIPGANHFFWGQYARLAEEVAEFLDRHKEAR